MIRDSYHEASLTPNTDPNLNPVLGCKVLLEGRASAEARDAGGVRSAIELAQGDQRIYELFQASGGFEPLDEAEVTI